MNYSIVPFLFRMFQKIHLPLMTTIFKSYVKRLCKMDFKFTQFSSNMFMCMNRNKLSGDNYICNLILSFHDESEDEIKIENVMELFFHLKFCCKEWFQDEPCFMQVVKEVFEDKVNESDSFSIKLARWIDDILINGIICVSGMEYYFRNTMQTVIALYRFIQEKNVFERHYQLLLDDRLVNKLSYDLKWEQDVIHFLGEAAVYMVY